MIQPDTLVSSGTNNSAKISEYNNLLECHICHRNGFTAEGLKVIFSEYLYITM